MYDITRSGGGPGGGEAKQECKPDYEKVAAKQQEELKVIDDFKNALLDFIEVIGMYNFKKQGSSSIPELLGTVELDILNRKKQYMRTLRMLEKDK